YPHPQGGRAVPRYPQVLTQHEIIKLLRAGVYCVDPRTAEVTRGGRVVTPFVAEDGRAWVRLYDDNKRKMICRNRLVWMSQTLAIIPRDFEIHHDDLDNRNDAWDNLVCLHKLD